MSENIFNFSFANEKLVIELGTMANLSAQAVTVRYGDTVVLTTVNYNDKPSSSDFFPLTVVFQEKLYSIGKIPGGFLKREGFPTEYATLCARLIDRSIRPLFPKGFYYDVQVVNNVLALSENHDVRFVCAFATSLALSLSGLPFQGPTATVVVVGAINDQLVINPTKEQLNNSQLELIVGGTNDAINMIEAQGLEIGEGKLLEAVAIAHEEIKKLIKIQTKLVKEFKKPDLDLPLIVSYPVINDFLQQYQSAIKTLTSIKEKNSRNQQFQIIIEQAKSAFFAQNLNLSLDLDQEKITKLIANGLEDLLKSAMRTMILTSNKRIDGRVLNEIRPLSSKIDLLPIVHGSAMFNRGETQVLSIVTLGALYEQQIIDDLGKDDYKRFMHHYNFPPFSVGETGRIGKPSRREIGHGALGEKALLQILPSELEFPYTIRIVSEVLASNGSTSQAAICASSLALMAAGVPIKAAIAGIAMGLIKEQDHYAILTDIQGLEDHLGDMDFKVAGTSQGICALQMDIKIKGLDFDILTKALNQAKIARMQVLENMNQVIAQPKVNLAANAPKILQKQIPVDKIRDIIGSGGKVINKIISEANNVKIDIEDDGRILIYHQDQKAIDQAWSLIQEIVDVKPVAVGDQFQGKVVKILNFGAFVNLKNGTDGLLHVSQLANFFNKKNINVVDYVKVNDVFNVKISEITDKDKIKLEIVK